LKDVGGGGGASRDEANTCRARLAIDGCMLCQPPPPPVVRVSRSMGVCFASHQLPSFASRVRWGCAVPATSSRRSRLAFDGSVLRQPPAPPIVRVSRSMGVCFASHHLHPSFVSRIRCGYALPATSSTHRSRLAFYGSVPRQPPPPVIVRVSRSMGVPRQPPTPVVRISRSMEVCCPSHQLHPSFASRVRWVYALPATTSSRRSCLAFDGGVLSQPPPPVVRVSRSMEVCCPIDRERRTTGVQLWFPLVR